MLQYLSFVGYAMMLLMVVSLVLCGMMTQRVYRNRDAARTEKTIRYVGITVLIWTLGFTVVSFDWASGHGFVMSDGRIVADIPSSSAQLLAWVSLAGTIGYGALLGTAMFMKRRRFQRALGEPGGIDRAMQILRDY